MSSFTSFFEFIAVLLPQPPKDWDYRCVISWQRPPWLLFISSFDLAFAVAEWSFFNRNSFLDYASTHTILVSPTAKCNCQQECVRWKDGSQLSFLYSHGKMGGFSYLLQVLWVALNECAGHLHHLTGFKLLILPADLLSVPHAQFTVVS